MSNEVFTVSEAELHAYVDQCLDPARLSQVEAYLSTNTEAAEKVRIYRQQNELLHATFDEVLNEPVPHYFLRPQKPVRNHWKFSMVAAAALTIGIGLGWLGHGEFIPGSAPVSYNLPAQAAMAHAVYSQEVVHPVEVGAAQQEHLVKWLSKRLNTNVRAPQLQNAGYELEGGRLLPGDKGPAAQFMYRDKQGQRLTLYLRTEVKSNENTAFRFETEGKISVFYWVDQNIAYALSAEVSRESLLSIAESVYSQLNQ